MAWTSYLPARETERSGRGPFGAHRYRGYRGLAELPYFELADDGRGGLVARDPRSTGEFLTSTDERFRPVCSRTGPDGAVYIGDTNNHRVRVVR